MIYLISNLVKLTPKNPTKNSSWPRLAIQLSKEQYTRPKMKRPVCRFLRQKNPPFVYGGYLVLVFLFFSFLPCQLLKSQLKGSLF